VVKQQRHYFDDIVSLNVQLTVLGDVAVLKPISKLSISYLVDFHHGWTKRMLKISKHHKDLINFELADLFANLVDQDLIEFGVFVYS
jgi:hypothetical protein